MATELLRQRLFWAPCPDADPIAVLAAAAHTPACSALAAVPQAAGGASSSGTSVCIVPYGAHVLCLEDYSDDEYLRGGRYSVPHYRPDMMGRAVGPLALDQVLAFSSLLKRLLGQHKCVAVVTPFSDTSRGANAAVLTGGFLILVEGWTLEQVCAAMPFDARLTFPCSWTRLPGPSLLNVRDCWEGLALACRCRWLDRELLQDPLYTSMACGQYGRVCHQQDAAWVVPGRVLVGADPMTVIYDPDPSTCSHLTPDAPHRAAIQGAVSAATAVPSSCDQDSLRFLGEFSETTIGPVSLENTGEVDIFETLVSYSEATADDPDHALMMGGMVHGFDIKTGCEQVFSSPPEDDDCSVHTVCKQYRSYSPETVRQQIDNDYTTWWRSNGIVQIVRVNFADEPGLHHLGGSYDVRAVEHHGFAHLDVPVLDHGGGVPDTASIRYFLETCENIGEDQAVFIHCKGGFGRSVVMACCFLIAHYDLPGRALLGWTRIVRPGAITTPQQERFLASMSGAADLQKFILNSKGGPKKCCVIS